MPDKRVGGRPLSPWGLVIRELVEQGPVPFREAVEKSYSLVPPGYGYRRFLKRQRQKFQTGHIGYDPDQWAQANMDEAIRMGQQRVVYQTIRSLEAVKRISLEGRGADRVIRLGEHPW